MSEKKELPELICGKSIDEIRAMRAKHGHLFVVEVSDEGSTYYAVCKEPTMQIIEASQALGKSSETKGVMCLYDNCVILVDDEIRQRDMLKMQVAAAIGSKIGQLGAIAKNV